MKRRRIQELVFALLARLCLRESSEPPTLSAGVRHRMRLLYNSGPSEIFCDCLCGGLQALSLFHGHMHAPGITARIFKETAPCSYCFQSSAAASCPKTASDFNGNTLISNMCYSVGIKVFAQKQNTKIQCCKMQLSCLLHKNCHLVKLSKY